jgi:hypothetical protein
LLAGVALLEAVQQRALVDAALKWPNDLMIKDASGTREAEPLLVTAGEEKYISDWSRDGKSITFRRVSSDDIWQTTLEGIESLLLTLPSVPGSDPTGVPANTPYLLLSQGSSGSDRPLMHAAIIGVVLVLALFQRRQLAVGVLGQLLADLDELGPVPRVIGIGDPGRVEHRLVVVERDDVEVARQAVLGALRRLEDAHTLVGELSEGGLIGSGVFHA